MTNLENKLYNFIHFEALGDEARHLKEETEKAMDRCELPDYLAYEITPLNIQEYLLQKPNTILPDLITTKTHSKLPETYLNSGNKKSIITRSAGYDHFEHVSDIANIASLREYCVNAVAETAIGFMFAASRKFNHYSNQTRNFDRKNSETFKELTKRTATVYGVGKIGKRIYDMLQGLGINAQAVDIRQNELSDNYFGYVRFVSKEDAIKNSDVIINAMNLTRNQNSNFYNVDYFSKEYLSKAQDGLIFINVTRGEIAPELGLLELYNKGKISGLGLDVFTDESEFAKVLNGEKTKNNDLFAAKILVDLSLSREGNVYVSPHQGFNSDMASETKAIEAIKHIISFYKNDCKKFNEQLPYY